MVDPAPLSEEECAEIEAWARDADDPNSAEKLATIGVPRLMAEIERLRLALERIAFWQTELRGGTVGHAPASGTVGFGGSDQSALDLSMAMDMVARTALDALGYAAPEHRPD
jgi:hypothetical protein